MANVIKKTTNNWTKGLVMDFSPENTSNELLTHALNATLLTFNGNELSLQNDMGNARVETAFLPEGYIPVGTCEYGGIIYIVSYNPLEDKSLIGCFPSPERNISSDELGTSTTLQGDEFVTADGTILNNTKYVLLKDDKLNPGDKFIISSGENIYDQPLQDLLIKDSEGNYNPIENPIIALNIVSIEDSGKIVYLNSDVVLYEKTRTINENKVDYKYHILGELKDEQSQLLATDIDSYRNVVSSGYSVFKSKTSGKLAILAELIMIDSYSVTYGINQNKDINGNPITGSFDIVIHTDVTPEVNSTNYTQVPKLKYYHLSNSLGYILLEDKSSLKTLFCENEEDNPILNLEFLDLKLSDIDSRFSDYDDTLNSTGLFNFPKAGSYHGRMEPFDILNNSEEIYYTKFFANKFHRISNTQISFIRKDIFKDYYINEIQAKFYIYNNGYTEIKLEDYDSSKGQLFISVPFDTYIPNDKFVPNAVYNDIQVLTEKSFPELHPVETYTISDFIPNSSECTYNDVTLASIKIPEVFSKEKVSFPFKYEYTLVPCMNYGRLSHLAISNTIDFSKIDDFSASDFNVWKYHIDGNQLRLTFGAEIYDALLPENEKVNALVLEFYDIWGFVGSIEINDRKSYSGVFTKLLSLNSYNALSKLKISGNTYTNTYKHNINIYKEGDSTKFINKDVTWKNENDGWEGLTDEENDCGVLYSNILYGVKSYLRINDGDNYKFIPKSQFFLYTLPIYNSQYYNCNNFNELEYPKLDLMLTYKLQDSSIKEVYSTDKIINGYGKNQNLIEEYLTGTSQETNISTVKYYKYKGTSNLYLEVGLKKEYADFNVNYDAAINKYFTCKLQLLGNKPGESYSVQSETNSTEAPEQILYYDELVSMDDNQFGFNNNSSEINIQKGKLSSMNFISSQGTNPIPINYEFIVGYKVDITDIKSRNIQTTTVSALFHKRPDGTYNYEDFSIYYDENELEDNCKYKSYYAFYNDGDYLNEEFGLCRQKSVTGVVTEQMEKVEFIKAPAEVRMTAGSLNAGNPMRLMMQHIGKLSFCLPHAHGVSDITSVNIGKDKDSDGKVIYPDITVNYNDVKCYTNGTAATDYMYKWPAYSMGLITKQTAKYFTSYISTIEYLPMTECYVKIAENENGSVWYYHTTDDGVYEPGEVAVGNIPHYATRYAGFGGKSLANYNMTLLETMKNVYGYNPDYNTQSFNIGDINIVDNKIKFTSSLISTNSNIDLRGTGKVFNDFIYFGGALVSEYLENMNIYSNNNIVIYTNDDNGNITTLPQITFDPNYMYCGGNNLGFLVSSLTYNTPVPQELEESLTFNLKNTTLIKHYDGTNTIINGIPDKKTLYSWDSTNKFLVELDVKNYTIDANGTLSLKNYSDSIKVDKNYLELNISGDPVFSGFNMTCNVGYPGSIDRERLTANITISDGFVKRIRTTAYIRFDLINPIIIKPNVKCRTEDYDCEIEDFSIEFDDIYYKILKSDINLSKISNGEIEKIVKSGEINGTNYNCTGIENIKFLINNEQVSLELKTKDKSLKLELTYEGNPNETPLGILQLKVKSISLQVRLIPKQTTSRIKSSTKTTNYSFLTWITGYDLKSDYNNSRLRNTNIVLNDLVYDGTDENHRLYLRDGCYDHRGETRKILYYRNMKNDGTEPHKNMFIHSSWNAAYSNLNALHLFWGPSFIIESENTNGESSE